MTKLIALILLTSSTALAAVSHTKAQAAYFKEHDKCVSALRAAKKEANAAPPDERKKLVDAAKESYRRCEERAHLVWKFYPQLPPPAPQ
jgi:hypothetical protein